MEYPLIRTEGINKYFPGVHALKNIDFDLKVGEVHTLLGENGAGKSTLIKILSGLYEPEEGKIFLDDKETVFHNAKAALDSGISVIYQELNLSLNISITENIFFGRLNPNKFGFINWKELHTEAKKWMSKIGLNVSPSMKVKYLGTAQQQLLEIAKALATNAKVIIMDEPTSALSPHEIKILFDIIRDLKSKGIGIIYVSHKLDELYEIGDRVTVFRDGHKIETLNVADTTPDSLIKSMVGREIISTIDRKDESTPDFMLEVKDVSTNLVDSVSFDIKKGEIIGFSGLMGAGKTEISRALFGLDAMTAGSIVIEGTEYKQVTPELCAACGIGYVPEDRKATGLFLDLSVRDNISIATMKQLKKGPFIDFDKQAETVQRLIDRLSIKTPTQLQKTRNLSGGNQQKVILARWLLHSNLKLLIVDEPTRGIDVGAKQEIYSILDDLSKRGIAIIIMSSEMPELITMCDRILVMKLGRLNAILNKDEISQERIMEAAVM
ncbi:ribose import ATP-binding protein RbsA [Clostridia bacterium]|nr:ribose import ATP-binding protein RbsA [Clostridia bacterium]